MAKRRSDEATKVGPETKKRKQGLIDKEQANPVGSDGISQCFRIVKTRMHVALAPMFTAAPIEGIKKQHLDPLLLQYDQNTHGVIVSYSNVRLLKNRGTSEPLGRIINESPFSFYWIACDFLVWSPQPDDIVEGWVSIQSPGHVALLIHDTFNASIKRADIPEDWEFIPQEDDENGSKSLGHWQDAEGRRIDGKLRFKVKRFLSGGRTVLVLGSLLSKDDEARPQYNVTKSTHESRHLNKHETKISTEGPTPRKITFEQ